MESTPHLPRYSDLPSHDSDHLLTEHRTEEKSVVIEIREQTDQPNTLFRSSTAQTEGEEHTFDGESLVLDRFFIYCGQQTPFVKAVFLAVITGIPFFIFVLVARFVVPKQTEVGPPGSKATVFELAKFLFIAWATFIGLLGCGKLLAAFFSWFCTLSKSFVRYQRLAEAVCLRVVMMLWAVVVWSFIPNCFKHSLGAGTATTNWVNQMRKAFEFISIAFAILIVQGFILELASVRYIQGWMGPRSQRAFDELDTIKQLHSLIKPHEKLSNKLFKKLLLPNNDRSLFHRILRGQANDDQMNKYADKLWEGIATDRKTKKIKASLSKRDIADQLASMKRGSNRAEFLFRQLDSSLNGSVEQREVNELVHRAGERLKTRAKAQHGIQTLLRKLEILLSIVMLGVMFFIYSK